MMKSKYYISTILMMLLLVSCGQKSDPEAELKQKERKNIEIYLDQSLSRVIVEPLRMFDSLFANYTIQVDKTTAFDAMANLLGKKAEVIILGRDYTHEEDSLMEVHLVEPYFKMNIAKDALVFFTNAEHPLDTLTEEQISQVMAEAVELKSFYPVLDEEPIIAVTNNLSSEMVDFKRYVMDGKKINRKLKIFPTTEEVMNYVLENKNSIGIGFFSNIVKDPKYKPLAISYTDTSGAYVFPHVVHQANILQGFYPYTVNYYIYLRDKNNESFLALGRFLTKSSVSQRYFNEFGIVPGYAKIKLIDER